MTLPADERTFPAARAAFHHAIHQLAGRQTLPTDDQRTTPNTPTET